MSEQTQPVPPPPAPRYESFTLSAGALSIQWPRQITADDARDIEEHMRIWLRKVQRVAGVQAATA